MSRHRPEVADVFRTFGATYLKADGFWATAAQRRVLADICRCRTAALGGHKTQCDSCGHEVISYNSCRNRHCPKCQGRARAEWVEAHTADLLEVPYFHVVFTLPQALSPLALQNKRLLYGLLFRAASETLLTIARDPTHLGADIGFVMVLHTWGQTLTHHPHVHAVVPGGGLAMDGSRWVPTRERFFLPVRVLSKLFRTKLLALLANAYRHRKLALHGTLRNLLDPGDWKRFRVTLAASDWVVYAKPPFGGPEQVLKYLSRYTHRVAISNPRLISIQDGTVTFRWKDYAHQQRRRTMTLGAIEFIRRFLLHVLPKGFVRIRAYGVLANRIRKKKLALCRTLIGSLTPGHAKTERAGPPPEHEPEHNGTGPRCPACKTGRLIHVGTFEPLQDLLRRIAVVPLFDTS